MLLANLRSVVMPIATCKHPHVVLCVRYWNNVNFKGSKQSFADGGGTDNLAVTPLIRRKVTVTE